MREQNKKSLFSWKLIFSPIIVLICMLMVYKVAHIFPFGSGSIVYNDMGQCNVPIFYSLWDALHGNGSILFNLRTAGGVFVTGEFENAMSPFNLLFFLLCPRAKILESMSFFLMLKLMITGFTASLYFRYKFNLSDFWNTIFSVLYVFNPFTLQYYTNISWIEVVMIFPLVMLGLELMFRENKILLYTLALSYTLIVQLYIAYMIMLFLFISGGLNIGLNIQKEYRKKSVLRFGISSVLALFISAFSALPTYFYMSESSRFQNTRSYFQVLVANTTNPLVQKGGMAIIMTALPTAIVIGLLFLLKKERKSVLFHTVCIAFFLIPIIFENVNLLWHMGSYVNFPMRFAFIYQLVLLSASAFVLEKLPGQWHKDKKLISIPAMLVSVISAFLAIYVLIRSYSPNANKLIYKDNLAQFVVAFILLCIAYFFLLHFGFKKVSSVLIGAILLSETCVYVFTAVTSGSLPYFEYNLDYIEECDNIHSALKIPDDSFTRVKNIDGTLNSNYPLIIDHASMSNFTHIIPSTIKMSMSRLGYSTVYTRILDTGGTLFTDAVLGYKYALSLSPLSKNDYSYSGTAGRYLVYQNNYALPFGLVTNGNLDNYYTEGVNTQFDDNNKLWKLLSGSDEDLFLEPDAVIEQTEHTLHYDFYVDGTKEIYMYAKINAQRRNMQIYVNGEPIHVPSLGEPQNTKYNTRFNNGVLDLGEFSEMPVSITVQLLSDKLNTKDLNFTCAQMNKDLLSDYCNNVKNQTSVSGSDRNLTFTANGKEGQYLFLPMSFDEGWKCTVNNHSAKINVVLDNFMLIPLEQGNNQIELHYTPKGFRLGLIVSALALMALGIWVLLNRKWVSKIQNEKPLNILLGIYYGVSYAAIGGIYLLPVAAKIILWFTTKQGG